VGARLSRVDGRDKPGQDEPKRPGTDRMRYAVGIEKGERNYSAYVPDVPGCVSVGNTVEQVKSEVREEIELHIEGMRGDGLPIREPSSRVEYVEFEKQSALAALGGSRKSSFISAFYQIAV
jgi:predicted RNase H-like HicB family nuclease